MAGSKKRITLHSLEREGERITALCGSTLEETKQIVGAKLGFATPSACRLFNKHGAEIDHLDLVMHDDLLYASAGGDFPQVSKNPKSSSRLHSAGISFPCFPCAKDSKCKSFSLASNAFVWQERVAKMSGVLCPRWLPSVLPL